MCSILMADQNAKSPSHRASLTHPYVSTCTCVCIKYKGASNRAKAKGEGENKENPFETDSAGTSCCKTVVCWRLGAGQQSREKSLKKQLPPSAVWWSSWDGELEGVLPSCRLLGMGSITQAGKLGCEVSELFGVYQCSDLRLWWRKDPDSTLKQEACGELEQIKAAAKPGLCSKMALIDSGLHASSLMHGT